MRRSTLASGHSKRKDDAQLIKSSASNRTAGAWSRAQGRAPGGGRGRDIRSAMSNLLAIDFLILDDGFPEKHMHLL